MTVAEHGVLPAVRRADGALAASGALLAPVKRALTLLAALALASCGHRSGGATAAELRLSTNPEVRWESGAPRELAAILENTGSTPLSLPEPSPARARVLVFAPGGAPACTKEPAAAHPARVEELAPGERRALVVPLASCALPAGEFRYEAWYVADPAAGAGAPPPVGPVHGRIVVERPPARAPSPDAEQRGP